MFEDDPGDASSLLGQVVRHRGTWLGQVVDVLLSEDGGRVLGLEVKTAGDYLVFLPTATWERAAAGIEVPIPLSILSEHELRYYERSARRLRELLAEPRSVRLGATDDG